MASCGSEKADPFIPSQPAVGGLTVTAVVEDKGVAGVGIRIQGPETKTGTTNSSGTAVFSAIAPGSYTVDITSAPDSVEFARTSRTVSVPSGGSASVAFLGALKAG
jgi:outer membrane usher protein FimD/PapC